MSISEPFIRRPIGTSLLMLGVLVFGIGAYNLLPVAALPKVDFPTIAVTVNYAGASPDTMASAVATPLEQQFAALPGLAEMTSMSGVGATLITLQFDLDRNIDAAAQDVQQAINASTGLLPKDLPNPPIYRKTNPADRPVLIYAVHSDGMPVYRIDDYAYTILAQKAATVKGVSESRIFGQKPFAVHIQVNPAALAARGISLEDVRIALTQSSVNRPKGNLEGTHQAITLDTNDQLFNAAGFRNVIIAWKNGSPVRLGDIAEVVDSVQNARADAWFEGKPAEGLAIQREAGANTIQVVDTIKSLLPKLQESIPPSVHVDLISDRSTVIRAAVHDVQFTMTVSVAVIASAVISLTLTPVMCSLFLKGHSEHPAGWLSRMAERGFQATLSGYDRGLKFVFRHQFSMLVATMILMAGTGLLYMKIPKGFFPQQDTGFIFGQAEARQDISYPNMKGIVHELADTVRQDPAVSAVLYFAGASAYNPTENTARFFIQLKPHDERSVTSDQVIQRLRPKVAAVEGAKFFMQSGQDISVGGRLTKTQYQYTLTDTNNEELNHWAPIVEAAMQKLPELQDVASDQQVAAPHLAIDIDRDAAARLGLSPSAIDETLYDAFGQRQILTMYTATNQYKVILEVKPEFQLDPGALSKIYVGGPNGVQVPLSSFAKFTSKIEPLLVNHQGQFPAVTMAFNLAPGVALGEAVSRIQRLQADLHLPGSLDGQFMGTAQAFQASLSSTPLLVAAAILVVYIVLGVLYESYIHPITILSALPSAGVGALLALILWPRPGFTPPGHFGVGDLFDLTKT